MLPAKSYGLVLCVGHAGWGQKGSVWLLAGELAAFVVGVGPVQCTSGSAQVWIAPRVYKPAGSVGRRRAAEKYCVAYDHMKYRTAYQLVVDIVLLTLLVGADTWAGAGAVYMSGMDMTQVNQVPECARHLVSSRPCYAMPCHACCLHMCGRTSFDR